MTVLPNPILPSKKVTRRFAGGRLRAGTIAGFPIYLHWTLLVLLIPFFLSSGIDSMVFVQVASMMILSIIIHELAHALSAQRLGLGTGSITIWILGGYYIPYQMECIPFEMERAWRLRYILMVLSGPLSNIALSILFYLGFILTRSPFIFNLANLNLSLGIVNLFPLPPLDGSQAMIAIASLSFKRRQIYIALLVCLLIIFIGSLVFADFIYNIQILQNIGGLTGMGIIWILRLGGMSDDEFNKSWQDSVMKERLVVEGE